MKVKISDYRKFSGMQQKKQDLKLIKESNMAQYQMRKI